MEADFDRYYNGRDLGELIWIDGWPGRKLAARVAALPEDSAFGRACNDGHTSIHELLASIHDRVTVTAHGWRLEGKPQNWQRPGAADPDPQEGLDPRDPANAAAITRFFGLPRN